MTSTAFTDPSALGQLYVTTDRLAQRTSALHAAKVCGPDAAGTIADLAATRSHAESVADIGCGRGTTTLHLARRLPAARILAVDRSPALLHAARQRLLEAGTYPGVVCADFHHLPIADESIDVAVAAFCLYHSPHPGDAIGEIARCLTRGGLAVIATKSAYSYAELDHVVAASGLDPAAATRPSLYTTFHSTNAPDIVSQRLRVRGVEHQRHVFRFNDLDHLAAYLATTPKYHLPPDLAADRDGLADALRARLPKRPVTVTSTVTYIAAARA